MPLSNDNKDDVKDFILCPHNAELLQLQEDVAEILEWVRNGKRASQWFMSFTSWSGRTLIWLAKVGAAITVIWSLLHAIQLGKLPSSSSINIGK